MLLYSLFAAFDEVLRVSALDFEFLRLPFLVRDLDALVRLLVLHLLHKVVACRLESHLFLRVGSLFDDLQSSAVFVVPVTRFQVLVVTFRRVGRLVVLLVVDVVVLLSLIVVDLS